MATRHLKAVDSTGDSTVGSAVSIADNGVVGQAAGEGFGKVEA